MHFIWAISQAESTDLSVCVCEEEILGDSCSSVNLVVVVVGMGKGEGGLNERGDQKKNEK